VRKAGLKLVWVLNSSPRLIAAFPVEAWFCVVLSVLCAAESQQGVTRLLGADSAERLFTQGHTRLVTGIFQMQHVVCRGVRCVRSGLWLPPVV